MKFNLKNRPNLKAEFWRTGESCDWIGYGTTAEKWFEGFEKELRELAEIYEKSDHVEHWAILQFIKEILGE